MEFEIKEGIPLPVGRGKPRKYNIPLETMKVGDHILIELPKTNNARGDRRISIKGIKAQAEVGSTVTLIKKRKRIVIEIH